MAAHCCAHWATTRCLYWVGLRSHHRHERPCRRRDQRNVAWARRDRPTRALRPALQLRRGPTTLAPDHRTARPRHTTEHDFRRVLLAAGRHGCAVECPLSARSGLEGSVESASKPKFDPWTDMDRDEVGLAVAPMIGAAVACSGFGSVWHYAFLVACLFAYLVALSLAWPLVHVLRRRNCVSLVHFTALGLGLAIPFAAVPIILASWLRLSDPGLGAILIMAGGSIAGAAFWGIADRPRTATER